MPERKGSMTSFRVTKDAAEGYRVARFMPRKRSIGSTIADRRIHSPNRWYGREPMHDLTQHFLADAQDIGLEMGQKDSAVQLLTLSGMNLQDPSEKPLLLRGHARMRIKDERGNNIQFRMTLEQGNMDEKNRLWDKVHVHIEKATIEGKHIHVPHELSDTGINFLTFGMKDILSRVKNGDTSATTTIRPETTDLACFYDGHHGSAGDPDLGCFCKEERAKSLDIIHERGGIAVLIAGPGNGNGSEAQEEGTSIRNDARRRGLKIPSYQETYTRMGKEEDNRQEALKISTIILKHLFQMENVPSITILSDSTKKASVWDPTKHTIHLESLDITPPTMTDSQYKQQELGYRGSGVNVFPLRRA